MTVPAIRVLCVDDHSVVREGISLIIDMQSICKSSAWRPRAKKRSPSSTNTIPM